MPICWPIKKQRAPKWATAHLKSTNDLVHVSHFRIILSFKFRQNVLWFSGRFICTIIWQLIKLHLDGHLHLYFGKCKYFGNFINVSSTFIYLNWLGYIQNTWNFVINILFYQTFNCIHRVQTVNPWNSHRNIRLLNSLNWRIWIKARHHLHYIRKLI